ncbi:hypothetical protein P3S67_018490 [Capsicum chacoense]
MASSNPKNQKPEKVKPQIHTTKENHLESTINGLPNLLIRGIWLNSSNSNSKTSLYPFLKSYLRSGFAPINGVFNTSREVWEKGRKTRRNLAREVLDGKGKRKNSSNLHVPMVEFIVAGK